MKDEIITSDCPDYSIDDLFDSAKNHFNNIDLNTQKYYEEVLSQLLIAMGKHREGGYESLQYEMKITTTIPHNFRSPGCPHYKKFNDEIGKINSKGIFQITLDARTSYQKINCRIELPLSKISYNITN